MTFEDLELFRAVAERLSFTDAAKAVAMSQPTASRRIRAMEEELGATLIVRDSTPLSLTPFGFLFLNFADEVLQKYRALVLTADQNHSIIGTLTIATSSSPAARLVTQWMAEFLTAHPGVHVRLTEMHSAAVEEAVLRGDAEIGFMGIAPQHPDLVGFPIGDDDIVLLVPKSGPFQQLRRPLNWAQLYDAPFIVRRPGSGTRKVVEAAVKERGWPWLTRVVLEVDTAAALIDAVESGLGAGFVSRELLFRRELRRSAPCPVHDLVLVRPLYLAYHVDRVHQRPLAYQFLRYAQWKVEHGGSAT
ncbi:MAG: LysR family transcriptional regulator [Firmicutes bacterium]|nr:LysR family transcriptional regulator [Bacillota bacterium]